MRLMTLRDPRPEKLSNNQMRLKYSMNAPLIMHVNQYIKPLNLPHPLSCYLHFYTLFQLSSFKERSTLLNYVKNY